VIFFRSRGNYRGYRGITAFPITVSSYSSHCSKAAGTYGNSVPIVKVIKNELWTALRTIFLPKMHYITRFCTYILDIFQASYARIPAKAPRGAWTQTPISTWLASVPIVRFTKRPHNPHHALNNLMPEDTACSYELRRRRHGRILFNKTTVVVLQTLTLYTL